MHQGLFSIFLIFVVGTGVHRAAVRKRRERRRRGRGEWHQIRAAAKRERQVEEVRVVHRIEAAQRQEGQVAAVQREDGVSVGETAVGHVPYVRSTAAGAAAAGDADPAQRLRAGLRPGQPGGIGRPGQAAGRPVVGGGQLRRLSGGDLDQEHPAVAGGRRDRCPVRGRGQLDHAAELPVGQRGELRAGPVDRGGLLGAVGAGLGEAGPGEAGFPEAGGFVGRAGRDGDDQAVLPGGVADPGGPAGRAEDDREPGPRVRVHGQRPRRAVPVGQPVHGAAYLDHGRLPGPVAAQRAQVVSGRDQPRDAGRRRGPGRHLDPPGLRGQVIQDPGLAGHVIDDTGAVGAGVAGVEAVVVGVPAQAGTVQVA